MKQDKTNNMRLVPDDEYTHDPGQDETYNESMYFNAFDHSQKLGGWFRLGNRPNQGYAEMSVCFYLPDGRVAFMFDRPQIHHNDEMNAGGMEIRIIEPLNVIKVSYTGSILLLSDPNEMTNPKLAFRSNPTQSCEIELVYTGVSPVHGGAPEQSNADDPLASFAKAHYEQSCLVEGAVRIGDERFSISGLGVRDKSWGPRQW